MNHFCIISSSYLDSSDHKEDHKLLLVGGGVLIGAADEVCIKLSLQTSNARWIALKSY